MIFPFLFHTEHSFLNRKRIVKLNHFKILFAISLIGLAACDKIPDGVVDIKKADYSINQITAPAAFISTSQDSVIITTIKFNNSESVAEVFGRVTLYGGEPIIYDRVVMSDDGNSSGTGDAQKADNIFAGKFVRNNRYASGVYTIEYYVKDNVRPGGENVTKIGFHNFNFSNGSNNRPPVISDLVMPASVAWNEDIIIHLKVSDPDGSDDILQSGFVLYDPTGAYVNQFPMFDDGNITDNADSVAGDGIYSTKKSFKTGVMQGDWKFVFQAKDKGGLNSNTITQNLTLK
jgi:hypothetical protein